MTLKIGDTAPNFTAETTEGTIDFHEWIGDSWAVLFSHPKDFTPVCTTELGAVAKIKSEFDKRNCKILGLSVDPLGAHVEWSKDIAETQGMAPNFPMIADADRKVSTLYDMIHPNASDSFTVRSVFVIGPDKKVKLIITYPQSTGRNVDELMRKFKANLYMSKKQNEVCPSKWRDEGDKTLVNPGPQMVGRVHEALHGR